MPAPWISFYTPHYRRPTQLAACLESVRRQSAVKDIEQVVIVDHVGIGVGGMFGSVHVYADALHGEYVHFLCDDDVLAGPLVVARLKAIVDAERDAHGRGPHVVIVGSQKPGGYYPAENHGPPVEGSIDLGCFVVRRDVWAATCDQYGQKYEGDYVYVAALWEATEKMKAVGVEPWRWIWQKDLHFVTGEASRGRFEGQWP